MITRASVPSERPSPSHVEEVFLAMRRIESDSGPLWKGAGIDGRRVAALLDAELAGWSTEGAAGFQELTWEGAKIRPFRVDGKHGKGISILEIEGGGALQKAPRAGAPSGRRVARVSVARKSAWLKREAAKASPSRAHRVPQPLLRSPLPVMAAVGALSAWD